MAHLRLSSQITHLRDPYSNWRPNANPETNLSADGVFEQVLDIGTTAENVSFGDVTPGLVILINLDDANYVTYGMSDAGTQKTLGRLYPLSNWPAMFWLEPSTTLRMQANTAACKVYVKAYPTPA